MLHTLFVDFNSFFASVEQQLQPHLRGRPVGVVPVVAESTCCIAASVEAKAYGVTTGTPVYEARRRCPEIVFVLAEHAKYVEVHQRAIAVIDQVVPVQDVMSIDEMACGLTGRWRERSQAERLARQVKAALRQQLGECLTCSIGIAPNTLLAKLASNMHKPDGLTVLEAADLPSKLLHLPPAALYGVGPRMVERLARVGITTMAELYAAPRELLRTAWGGVAGDEMHDKLRGLPYAPRAHATRSLGHSHVLPPALRHPEGAFSVLNRLTHKAAMRLRKQGFYATGMSLSVRCGPRSGERVGGGLDTRFGETQDTAFLLQTLHTLWHSGLHRLQQPKAVGITLQGLVPADRHTLSLFDAAPLDTERTPLGRCDAQRLALPSDTRSDALSAEWLDSPSDAPSDAHPETRAVARAAPRPARDRSRLDAAMDRINQTYGKNALYYASAHAARNEAPMRIAFHRIPDLDTER